MQRVQKAHPVFDSGLLTLIGAGHTVAANQYGASVLYTLPVTGKTSHAGRVCALTFISTAGAILTPACTLFLLTADPATSPGDTALTAAEHATVRGSVDIAATDWRADAAGATATATCDMRFASLAALAFVVKLAAGAPTFAATPVLRMVAAIELDD